MNKKKIFQSILSIFMSFAVVCAPTTIGAAEKNRTMPLATTVAYNSSTKLAAPQVKYYLTGEKICLYWNKVTGASSYEVYTYTGSNIGQTKDTYIYLPLKDWNNKENKSYILYVRAVSASKCSDYSKCIVTFPKINYSYVNEYQASCLSLNQLLEWAKYHNLDYDIVEENGIKTCAITEVDKSQEGIWKKFKRGAMGLLDGLLGGASDKIDDITASGLFSDTLINLIDSGSVKDAVKDTYEDTKKDVTDGAKEGAIESAFLYIFADVDMHYDYYFDAYDTKATPLYAVISMEYKEHEDLKSEIEKKGKADKNGIYKRCFDTFGSGYCFEINKDYSSNKSYPRWISFVVPTR